MPWQAQDFWYCDYCSTKGFRSFDEAKAHEHECPESARKRPRSGSSSDQHAGMAPISAAAETEMGVGDYHESRPKPRRFNIMATNDTYRHQLDRADALACQNLEVFETGPQFEGDSRMGPIAPGQVGIRCVHCTQQATDEFNMYFPGSIGLLGSGIQMVAERHLIQCPAAPEQMREELKRATEKRKRDREESRSTADEQRSQMALMTYCSMFCRNFSIVDKYPSQSGMSFADTDQQHQYQQYAPTPHHPRAEVPYLPSTGPRPPPNPLMMAQMGDSITPTPLARSSKDQQDQAPPPSYGEREGGYSGYPTPFTSEQKGIYQERVQTPHIRTDQGHEGPAPQLGPPQDSPFPGFSTYSPYSAPPWLQGDFPYFQDSSSSWSCKYCSFTPPQFRDHGATWSGSDPPPGPFINQHLQVCRPYNHAAMAPPPGMYQRQPPPGYGFATPPPPSYSGQPIPHFYSNIPPGVDPNYPYVPPPPSGEPYPGMAPRRSEASPRSRDRRGGPGHPLPPNRGHRSDSGDSAARQAINYLVAAEEDMYRLNPSTAGAEQLVLDEDKMLLTDYFFHLMRQLRVCRFAESDRKTRGGKRENIAVGYGGLQCIHCADAPNARKFFWSNVDRLANSFAEIPAHILKCRRCPQQTKTAILDLKAKHPEQMAKLPRGSQKVFFRRMWRRLHESDPPKSEESSPEGNQSGERPIVEMPVSAQIVGRISPRGQFEAVASSPGTSTDESAIIYERPTDEAAKALAASLTHSDPPSPSSRVLLGIPEDKEWLSDMDCFVRRNLEVFCATAEDVKIAEEDRKYPISVGQVGMRCIHCALVGGRTAARGSAVAFPYSISGIYEAVREFQRLHLEACPNLPPATKQKLEGFKGSSSLSSVLRKYYVLAANALGMYDTPDGIRSGAEAVPLGSSAAFAFTDESSVTEGMRKEAGGQGPSAAFSETGPTIKPLESRKRKQPYDPSDDPPADEKPSAVSKSDHPQSGD